MANGERFVGEMGVGARPERKIDVKRIKKALKAKGDSVFDENETFDLKTAQKEAYKSKKKNKSKIAIKDSVVADTKLPKDDSAEINIKESVITGKTKSASGDKEEELALKVWLKKQKSLGRDTVATRFIEEEIKEEKIESVAAPVETKDEVKTEAESRTQTEEASATERPEEISTGDLERKKERIEELEKKEKELLEIFEQNKNKPWEDRAENINEITKVRIEKSEIKEEVENLVQEQPEDFESEYEIVKKRTPTDEEREKLNPLLTKITNTADIYIPEKFIEEEPNASLGTKTEQIKNDKEGFIKGAFEEALDIISEKNKKILELESNLAAMENALKEKIEELTVKDATKLDKFKKFITNPKVKLAIGLGLIGAASVATGGGALVGAWLHLPYGLGISALGGTSNLTTALLGSGFIGRAYGDKIKNGFRENMKEVLGIIKNEEKTKNSESAGAGGEVKFESAENASEKPENKKEGFLNKIFGKFGKKGLTLDKRRQMREIARKNDIDIIGTGMNEDEVFKDYEKRRQEITDKYKNDKNFKEIFAELEKLAKNEGFKSVIIEEKDFRIANTVPGASRRILDESTEDKVFLYTEKTKAILIGERVLGNIKNLFETDKEFALRGFTSIFKHEKQHDAGPLQRFNEKQLDRYAKLPKNADFNAVASINIKDNKELYPFEEMQTELQRINVEYKDIDDFIEAQANHYMALDFIYQPDSFNFYRKHRFGTDKGFSEESSATRFIKPELQKKIIARMEEMRQNLVEKYTKPFEDEAKILEQFLVKFKAGEKDGKEVFDYFNNKLLPLYNKGPWDFLEITYSGYLKDGDINKLSDFIIDYLRENNLIRERERARKILHLFYPHGLEDEIFPQEGKRENVEWLGWEYKGSKK